MAIIIHVHGCQLVAGYYNNRPEEVPASPHWPMLVGAFFYLIAILMQQTHETVFPAAEVGCKQLVHNFEAGYIPELTRGNLYIYSPKNKEFYSSVISPK